MLYIVFMDAKSSAVLLLNFVLVMITYLLSLITYLLSLLSNGTREHLRGYNIPAATSYELLATTVTEI